MNKGDQVWFKGDLVTVISEPYAKFGGEFVDIELPNGSIAMMATPAQKDVDAQRQREDWNTMQAGFARLHK